MDTLTKSENPDEITQIQCFISICTVCYSDKHFVFSSPDNHHFICEQKEKSVKKLPYLLSLP